MFLMAAATAYADSDTVKNVDGSLLNACNGENVSYTGTLHIVSSNKPGMINMMIDHRGKGVGDVTGASYNVADNFKSKMKAPPGDVIFRQWDKAVAKANVAPDFFVVDKVVVHNDGTTDRSFDYRCHQEDNP